MYADYDFYTNDYHGFMISESEFPYFSERASAYIDSVTFGRAKKLSEDNLKLVKLAVCACCETYKSVQKNPDTLGISSETVGDHTISYTSTSAAQTAIETGNALYRNVKQYLGHTGLMYKGASDDV